MLTGTTGLIVFIIAIVITVIISTKFKINLGIVAFAMAFLLGGCGVGLSSGAIAGLFPTNLFLTQMIATMFFGFAIQAGAFKGIVDRVIYACRGAAWALPLSIYLGGVVVSALGAGAEATPVVLSPLAFAMAAEMGFEPLFCAIASYCAIIWTGFLPWTGGGAMIFGYAEAAIGNADATKSLVMYTVMIFFVSLVVMLFYYFRFKLNKLKVPADIKKPEPFSKESKTALTIVIIVILILLIPNIINALFRNPVTTFITAHFDVKTVCLLGSVVFCLLHIGDPVDVVKTKIPWGLLLMVTGMCTLVNVGTKMGIVDTISNWLSGSVPTYFVPFALAAVGSLLSYVTSGLVIWPLTTAMVPALAASTGLSPIILMIAAITGPCMTGLSPISQGGANQTIGASDEVRTRIFWPQFRAAVFSMLVFFVFCLAGWFKLMELFI